MGLAYWHDVRPLLDLFDRFDQDGSGVLNRQDVMMQLAGGGPSAGHTTHGGKPHDFSKTSRMVADLRSGRIKTKHAHDSNHGHTHTHTAHGQLRSRRSVVATPNKEEEYDEEHEEEYDEEYDEEYHEEYDEEHDDDEEEAQVRTTPPTQSTIASQQGARAVPGTRSRFPLGQPQVPPTNIRL